MKKVGIDLGKKQSDACVKDASGKVVERFRVRTTRKALSDKFANREPCEILIESCRDAGWVHEHLKALGHKVFVLDTTRARTVGVGLGKRKTDRRDAEALAHALVVGHVPEAHVLSKDGRQLRDMLHAREQLVRTRTRLVTMIRGQFQGRGLEPPRCKAESFAKRLRVSELAGVEASSTQALLAVLDTINEQIAVLEQQLTELSEKHAAFERLCSAPGVKLIVSLAFIAALDDANRFDNAHEVEAYLGLVPSEYSTGGRQRLGRITKRGNRLGRTMLIQAAQSMLRTQKAQNDPLVVWAKQVADRRGRKKAVVALARRLAGVLWSMWVDGTFYDPKGLARESFAGLSRRARRAQAEARAMKAAVVAAGQV